MDVHKMICEMFPFFNFGDMFLRMTLEVTHRCVIEVDDHTL